MGYYLQRAKAGLAEAVRAKKLAESATRAGQKRIAAATAKVAKVAKQEARELARAKASAAKRAERDRRRVAAQRAEERRQRLKAIAAQKAAHRKWRKAKRGEPFQAPANVKHMPPLGIAFVGFKKVDLIRGKEDVGDVILKLLVDAKTPRAQASPDGICRVERAKVLEICGVRSWEPYSAKLHRLRSTYDPTFEYRVGDVAVALPGFEGNCGIYLHLHRASAM